MEEDAGSDGAVGLAEPMFAGARSNKECPLYVQRNKSDMKCYVEEADLIDLGVVNSGDKLRDKHTCEVVERPKGEVHLVVIKGKASATGNVASPAADAGGQAASAASGAAADTAQAGAGASAPSSMDMGPQQPHTPVLPPTSYEEDVEKVQQPPQAPKPSISQEAVATGKEHQGPSELGLEGGTSKEVGGQPMGSWLKKTVEAIPASPEAKLALGQLTSQVLRNPQGAKVWHCTNTFRLDYAKVVREYMETILEVLRKVLDRLEHSQPNPLGQDIVATVLKLLNSRTFDERQVLAIFDAVELGHVAPDMVEELKACLARAVNKGEFPWEVMDIVPIFIACAAGPV